MMAPSALDERLEPCPGCGEATIPRAQASVASSELPVTCPSCGVMSRMPEPWFLQLLLSALRWGSGLGALVVLIFWPAMGLLAVLSFLVILAGSLRVTAVIASRKRALRPVGPVRIWLTRVFFLVWLGVLAWLCAGAFLGR